MATTPADFAATDEAIEDLAELMFQIAEQSKASPAPAAGAEAFGQKASGEEESSSSASSTASTATPPSGPAEEPFLVPEPAQKRRCLRPQDTLSCSWPPSPSPVSPSWSAFNDKPTYDEVITEWWRLDMPEVDETRRFAIRSLKEYLQEYYAADKDVFWQKRSGKAVLSVVICQLPASPSGGGGDSGGLIAYRGMNTEVSLPAGSLCAERSAIAQAASSFRRAANIVAVATMDPEDKLNPLWPCEVCQSWLSKLRSQNSAISVMAVQSPACDAFAVRVNGFLQPPPRPLASLSSSMSPSATSWLEHIELAEGSGELPTEARELVYIDGSWAFLHSAHQHILRVARSRGTHLMVGVHSDEVLQKECGRPALESFETRLGRIFQNRHVDSVLKGAPWIVSEDLIKSLNIRKVIVGSVGKGRTQGVNGSGTPERRDPYRVAREMDILDVVKSSDDITAWSLHEHTSAVAAGVRAATEATLPEVAAPETEPAVVAA